MDASSYIYDPPDVEEALSNICTPLFDTFKMGYNLRVLTVGTVAVTITKAVVNADECPVD